MKIWSVLAAAVAAATMCGCVGGRLPGPDTADLPCSDRLHVSDDSGRTRTLEKKVDALIKAGKVTPSEELIRQLGRSRCRLKLAAPPAGKMTPAEIYAKYHVGVLVVGYAYKCGKCKRWHVSCASGLFITAEGVFLTNYHVVANGKGRKTMVVMTHDEAVYPVAEVLAASAADDVAILRIAAPKDMRFTPIPLSPDPPAVGTPVSVISHPSRKYYTLTHGVVSRYKRRKRGASVVTEMCITADFARGSSGGPVISDSGVVVGHVANTESIYYRNTKGKQENLQMVLKRCVPATSTLKLIQD